MELDWSFIDLFLVIHMEKDLARAKSTQQVLETYNVPFQFYIVEPYFTETPDKRVTVLEANIYESHCRAIEYALSKGANSVLILEDDVVVDTPFSQKDLDRVANFLLYSKDVEILLLGCVPLDWSRIPDKFLEHNDRCIYKIGNYTLSHAYILNKRGMNKMMKLPRYQSAYDREYGINSLVSYAHYPSLFHQTSILNKYPPYTETGLQKLINNAEYLYINYYWHVVIVFWIIIVLVVVIILMALTARKRQIAKVSI